ncbi:hypothetical protein PT974_12371 [Cladobotryum mycophilum]|uniref:YCII-related domain-containing protein n=1 Tax=Cladobotryum mycophilum TaxID=491253 RepID=A0ABR0S8S6_9HYPO
MPRYIFLMKADPMAEQPITEFPPEIFETMEKFNQEMNEAGILLGADGLRPTWVDSYRLKYSQSGSPEVLKGPFDVAKEAHVCGWWIVQTKDVDEALHWAKKIPMQCGEVVVRRIGEADELGDGFTKELREKEAKMRVEVAERNKDVALKGI